MSDDLDLVGLLRAGPIAPIENPYALYARLRSEAPVKEIEPGRRGFFVSRFDDVQTVLKEHDRFSSRSNGDRGIGLVLGRTIIGMDGSEHLKHRALITPALAPRALRGNFPKLVREIADRIVDGFAARGDADLVAEFTYLYPLRIFTELLGLDPRDVASFHDWAIDLSHVAVDPARGFAASERMRQQLVPVVQEQRRRPSEGLIGQLASAVVEGERLSDEEVISFLRLLVVAGAETTYHLLGSALFALLRDPDLLHQVRTDHSRIDAVLDETLRWESPIQILTREVSEECVLGDVVIPAGSEVIAGIGSANRDERRFPDPDRFDVDRRGESHIAFGLGRHYCAGSRLALLEARIGIETLMERLPDLRSDPAGQPSRLLGVAFRGPDHLRVRFRPR